MNKIFLGGTCADTTWREQIISELNESIKFFNPVVDNWSLECQKIEEIEKSKHCNIHFYMITCAMQGVFSIAEAIESVTTHGKITILHIVPDGFSDSQLKSLSAVSEMVKKHGGISYTDNDILRSVRALNFCFT